MTDVTHILPDKCPKCGESKQSALVWTKGAFSVVMVAIAGAAERVAVVVLGTALAILLGVADAVIVALVFAGLFFLASWVSS